MKKETIVKRLFAHIARVVGFFDGVVKDGLCAFDALLMSNNSHCFHFKLQCGNGSNMKDELCARWHPYLV